ncbi:MAG: ThiF family adenylyltransferase [Flavobacteriales bacterium]|jgi:molybdopterin/thiamine biosynthesis adenylyltransferase|nr:ThiF family adenylyltransferase [Flavobacteriales bacterium]MBK7940391.1 ThiF family adenylyltransferase [Flavobacteriales bacterium]MBK8950116.1 ThiF family adenylyltransferase [Flavobacteriales bacterium]MBK9699449.1 ThiF family adenylyltransferase [Flavobacteriales bacterium]
MSAHIRFKRHVRFLQQEGLVRALRTLDEGVDLPGGVVFEVTLRAIGLGRPEQDVRMDLAAAFGEPALADAVLERLFVTGLIERYDPDDGTYARFDRQLLLFDAFQPTREHSENIARQQRLAQAHMLILGLGGIGNQVALSLAAAGVGALTLVDADVVEESNLHRQILFAASDAGRPKVDAAADGLRRVAPECSVRTRQFMVRSADDWRSLIAAMPDVRYVMISADRPVQLVNWISDERKRSNYHFTKCGYMNTQGLIGPLLGPDTKGYEELFDSWGPVIDAQSEAIKRFNEGAAAPTMAASNAIMANIAALDLIKHITGIGPIATLEQRLLLDLRTYTVQPG